MAIYARGDRIGLARWIIMYSIAQRRRPRGAGGTAGSRAEVPFVIPHIWAGATSIMQFWRVSTWSRVPTCTANEQPKPLRAV